MDLIRLIRQDLQQRGAIPAGAGLSISDFDGVLDMIAGGGAPSYTGKLVSPRNALGIAAVWACINVLADDFATLPMPVYRWGDVQKEPDGTLISGPGVTRYEARDHYLWPLFMEQANPRMSANRFRRVMETWRQLWGNAYAMIDMNGRGQVQALWPIRADRVKVWMDDPSDIRTKLWYAYMPSDRNKAPIVIDEDHMLHVRGTSIDGITGLSPIEVHRQEMGVAMAMTEFGGRFYSNSVTQSGVLTHPGKLGPKGVESLRESMEKYRGLSNAHKLMILEEGMQFSKIQVPQKDAQFIESMGFNSDDIARIYKVPQHRIGLLAKATNNNIEQLAMEYVQYTLGPNAANWCGEIHVSLLSERERDSIFVDPDYSYLLTADTAARAQLYQMLGNQGALSADNMRHREGYNPLPGGIGRTPRVQSNTIPIGTPQTAPQTQGVLPAPNVEKKTNGHAAGLQ